MEEEVKKEVVVINSNVAAPISVSKADAYRIAQEQENNKQEVVEEVVEDNIVAPTKITKEELDQQRINEVNDLVDNELTRIVEYQYSKKTYTIMYAILGFIIVVILLEILYYAMK